MPHRAGIKPILTHKALVDVAEGRAHRLFLDGPTPAAKANLRVLESLGLLHPDMVWQMLGHSPVDPLFLVRTVRASKDQLGFHKEELVIGPSVAFLAGDRNETGHKAAVHIDVFTNDVVVVTRGDHGYSPIAEVDAASIFEAIKDEPAGAGRLEKLLGIIRGYVTTALEA